MKTFLSTYWLLITLICISIWIFIIYPLLKYFEICLQCRRKTKIIDKLIDSIEQIDGQMNDVKQTLENNFPAIKYDSDGNSVKCHYPNEERLKIEYLRTHLNIPEFQNSLLKFAFHFEKFKDTHVAETFNTSDIKKMFTTYIELRNQCMIEIKRFESEINNADLFEFYYLTVKNEFSKFKSFWKKLLKHLLTKLKDIIKVLIVVLLVSTLL